MERQRPERPPRYEGEDVRPTSTKELRGWFTYGLGAEIYAVCGVGSFLPVTLEQLARERGVLLSDKTISCVQHAAADGAMLARTAGQASDHGHCVVPLFGGYIDSASFAMYTFSLAVFVQALTLASLSAVADYGNNRKNLLVTFGLTGAVATMLFLVVFPRIYLVGSILVLTGVTCLGSSFVILNSYLPLLVAHHPSLRDTSPTPLEAFSMRDRDESSNIGQQHTATSISIAASNRIFPEAKVHDKVVSPELQLSAQISSTGVGIGYAAAVFVQILSILLLVLLNKTSLSKLSPTFPLRLVLFFVGLYWFTFTLVSRYWIRNRPGPPLPTLVTGKRHWYSWNAYVGFAWMSLWRTIRTAVKLKQIVIFLVAWFLLSDAIATISGTAILFAKVELQMATTAVALLSITVTTSGLVGAFCWPIISRRLSLKSNQTILCCIALMDIIPIYGLLGYLPLLQAWGWGGLQRPWEIYPLGIIYGFVMGGFSSYCRSFYGQLIPPGSEAAFYALYAITDKGSSVVGPTVVGVIVDLTGHIRPAFIFLAVLIVLPAPLIWLVDVERGREDGVEMMEKMRAYKTGTATMNDFASVSSAVREGGEEEEEAEGLLGESD